MVAGSGGLLKFSEVDGEKIIAGEGYGGEGGTGQT
jgi:hypothetical protein